MARKSLHVVFNDNSDIIYNIPAKDHEPVLLKGEKEDIKSKRH